MTDPLLERQRSLLRELIAVAERRAVAERECSTAYEARKVTTGAEFKLARQRVESTYTDEKASAIADWQAAQERITTRFETYHTIAEKEYKSTRSEIEQTFAEDNEKANAEYEEARWTATTYMEASKKGATQRREQAEHNVRETLKEIKQLDHDALVLIKSWGPLAAIANEEFDLRRGPVKDEPGGKMQRSLGVAKQRLESLRALKEPRWLKGGRLVSIFGLVWLVGLVPAWFVPWWPYWLAGWSALAILAATLCRWLLVKQARLAIRAEYKPLCQALIVAESAALRVLQLIAEHYEEEITKATKKCRKSLQQVDAEFKPRIEQVAHSRTQDQAKTKHKYEPLLVKLQQTRDHDWQQALDTYQQRMQQSEDRYAHDSDQVEARTTKLKDEIEKRHNQDWQGLAIAWQEGLSTFTNELTAINDQCTELFPAWEPEAWEHWSPPQSIPPGIRFGEVSVTLQQIPDGVPTDKRLAKNLPTQYLLPALLPFPTQGSLLLKATDVGRDQAIQAMQAVMLRYFTALPPGKVRFTIIDPVGLGESFAAFMHLADHDELLVTSRIWTEAEHIDQRMVDLTEHMGNVIQKYLRNQYQSIEEYNAQAGEVAEPYRIVVIANFPINFTPDSAKRLLSIATTGSSCGVYTLVSVDMKQPLPQGFSLADLEKQSLTLAWKDQRFHWRDPDLGKYHLVLDDPPDAELFTSILQRVGEQARAARRVEVGFDFVAPGPEQWWTGDSTHGIRVALGRAGATRRQFLHLGVGTAQHVLIAGKTGSGKSTLLHALIANVALLYAPDQVELYLIDFKKGVEFKTYAMHELPHARVIAIESEREFGLSVLQRLDTELRTRGERFRSVQVNDLAGFRQASPDVSMPRILLIVDEFQEFFIEDDKNAQEAALLLDRLVRQGRAFGLHVLLGSQTLGGAYSLARSTIDQMAVRVALQCSETDAHLILSKDNSAARLLTRPGEAIYNDANGLVEGNNLFQIVWLADSRREEILNQVHDLAEQRALSLPPQIVFEGNAPALVAKNVPLQQLLAVNAWPTPPRVSTIWLGEAIAIKDPTSAIFRPQSASNLLVLGQQEESALAVLSMGLIGLAAQHAPQSGTRLYVLDGAPVDSPHFGILQHVSDTLPHQLKLVNWRDLATAFTEINDEVSRREKARETDAAPWFVFIHGLQWYRDLRKQDDDFGLTRRGAEQPPNPAKQLANLLREGASVRIHCLVWCDTLVNLQRSLDRQGLREFEMRVLFQMSANDSSNLLDSPMASRLGLHRALFHSEERGQPEKFRPYGLPENSWLADLGECFAQRQTNSVG